MNCDLDIIIISWWFKEYSTQLCNGLINNIKDLTYYYPKYQNNDILQFRDKRIIYHDIPLIRNKYIIENYRFFQPFLNHLN